MSIHPSAAEFCEYDMGKISSCVTSRKCYRELFNWAIRPIVSDIRARHLPLLAISLLSRVVPLLEPELLDVDFAKFMGKFIGQH